MNWFARTRVFSWVWSRCTRKMMTTPAWWFALPAGVVYGVWTLYAWVTGKEAGIPVLITGELDEPIRYRFEED